MLITETPNKDLQVKKTEMYCDKCIQDSNGYKVAYPLMNTAHMYLISGASGSGKSSLIINLLKSNRFSKDRKHKVSYKNMFDKIIFVSPSAHTLKDSIFDNLPDDQMFSHLDEDVFETVEALTADNVENDTHTLLILDDVSTELRKNRFIEKELTQLAKNRRHLNLSIWIVNHRIYDSPPALRTNASMLFLFKPKSKKELEILVTEFMMMSNAQAHELLKHVFQGKHDFLLIDQSLRRSGNFEFFRNFNHLEITN